MDGGKVQATGSVPRLFDEFERWDATPKRHAEDDFSFLNRVKGVDWSCVREMLDSYFVSYPSGESASDLRARFRSSHAAQHLAAWWELYLFTLYTNLGYVLTPHPTVPGSTRRPDFKATRGREILYLEAAAVFPELDTGRTSNPELDAQVLDIIDKASNPSFMLGVEFLSYGDQTPRDREIVVPLEKWLSGLNPDEVYSAAAAGEEYPQTTISARGWALECTAYALSPEFRTEDHRLLGIPPGEGGIVADIESIRKAIRKKSSRYGELDAPYVIALLSLSPYTGDGIAASALFGTVEYDYIEGASGSGQAVRARNGVFTSENGPRATRVSAVLIAANLLPCNHAWVAPRLWLNRWTKQPLLATDGFATGTCSSEGVVEVHRRSNSQDLWMEIF